MNKFIIKIVCGEILTLPFINSQTKPKTYQKPPFFIFKNSMLIKIPLSLSGVDKKGA